MKRPIETLQKNATQFFDKTFAKYKSQMKCGAGCSKCCFTDITVFTVEAELILDSILNLSNDEANHLLEILKRPETKGACVFLHEDKCTIYLSRPIICRTQGLPLFLSEENVLDYCPKNFESNEPEREDWLNLNRLNTMLSIAEKTAEKKLKLKNGRISLKDLKKILVKNLNDRCFPTI
jgi:Fe-S-cluster containining protein